MESVTLFDLISYVETKQDKVAFRFEPQTYSRILASRTPTDIKTIAAIQAAHGGEEECSWHTALSIYATSYGPVQVMGFNLFGPCAFTDTIVEFLRPSKGIDYAPVTFRRLVESMKLDTITPQQLSDGISLRQHFGIVYNGSAKYADAIVEALKHFGFTPNL